MATAIGMDLIHVERSAAKIVAESGDQMLLIQGELVSHQYFDALATEVQETLQDTGQLLVGDLARRYNLTSELLTTNVQQRLGSIIQGRLEGGLLYTPAYVRRLQAQLRGALRGVTLPVPVPALVKSLRLDDAGGGVLVSGVLDALVSSGHIHGTLKGTCLPLDACRGRGQTERRALSMAPCSHPPCAHVLRCSATGTPRPQVGAHRGHRRSTPSSSAVTRSRFTDKMGCCRTTRCGAWAPRAPRPWRCG